MSPKLSGAGPRNLCELFFRFLEGIDNRFRLLERVLNLFPGEFFRHVTMDAETSPSGSKSSLSNIPGEFGPESSGEVGTWPKKKRFLPAGRMISANGSTALRSHESAATPTSTTLAEILPEQIPRSSPPRLVPRSSPAAKPPPLRLGLRRPEG